MRTARTAYQQPVTTYRTVNAMVTATTQPGAGATGMTYAEVADICGVPVGAVCSCVARARQDLLDAGESCRHGTG